jgi:hypothetical protein
LKERTNVLAPALNMKKVSEDKRHIDYTYGDFGVRVWKDHCQAIRRDNDASDWDKRI